MQSTGTSGYEAHWMGARGQPRRIGERIGELLEAHGENSSKMDDRLR